MAFDWLYMPSENGYNRMRHLSRTPPEYWSPHDRYNAGRERSKYFRARNKEFRKYGTNFIPDSAARRFRANYPGGEGMYFPYAEALQGPYREAFRDDVDTMRHYRAFNQKYDRGDYGSQPWHETNASLLGTNPYDINQADHFMDEVEWSTLKPVPGPFGWKNMGDRWNEVNARETLLGDGLPSGRRANLVRPALWPEGVPVRGMYAGLRLPFLF